MRNMFRNRISLYSVLPLAAAGAIALAGISVATAMADSPRGAAQPERKTIMLPDESVSRVVVVCNWLPSYLYLSNQNGAGQAYIFKNRETCKYAEGAMALAGISDEKGRKAQVLLELDLEKNRVLRVELKE